VVYHEVIKTPSLFSGWAKFPERLMPIQKKAPLGTAANRKDPHRYPYCRAELDIVFDIIKGNLSPIIHILYIHNFAVLRYSRFERHIHHRDISKGNVLYVEDDLPSSTGARSGEDETVVPEGLPHCFNEYYLGERCVEVLHNWAYTNVTPN
jgi:hypothetical protein